MNHIYTYPKIIATVKNTTDWEMILKNSHLEQGKFDKENFPVNIPPKEEIQFIVYCTNNKLTGLHGHAEWIFKDHQEQPIIAVKFDNPMLNRCPASITCVPSAVFVKVTGHNSNDYSVTYTVG